MLKINGNLYEINISEHVELFWKYEGDTRNNSGNIIYLMGCSDCVGFFNIEENLICFNFEYLLLKIEISMIVFIHEQQCLTNAHPL